MLLFEATKNGAAYGFGFFLVPEHQPADERGHRSVTLTTTDFTVFGWKGGVAMTGFCKVNWKQWPHAGPTTKFNAAHLEKRIQSHRNLRYCRMPFETRPQ